MSPGEFSDSLDAPACWPEADPHDTLGEVEATAKQWEAAAASRLVIDLTDVDAVVVAGVGGSGIVADLVAQAARESLTTPVLTHKRYGLPRWVGPRTLVVAVSYSGNTEETLTVAGQALERGARLAAVCSGGQLADLAGAHQVPLGLVPGGGQPRHSTGWLAVPLLIALGLADDLDETVSVLDATAKSLGRHVPTTANQAKQLGALLASRVLPVVYGTDGAGAVAALRAKNQLAENSKLPALLGVVPELCHNDVVAWEAEAAAPRGIVWLRDTAGEHPRDARRAQLVAQLVEQRCAWQETVTATGRSPLARQASLLLQVDLVSIYAALARGIDPTRVAAIDELKSALGPVED